MRASVPPAPRRPSSIPAAMTAFALATGCASAPRVPVRAAAEATKATLSRAPDARAELAIAHGVFNPPIALAGQDDAVVRVVTDDASCTGTLVADDLVLTAHHCVVERTQQGSRTYFSTKLLPARNFQVELGGDYLAWGSVRVKAIVAPTCGESGGEGDLAVMVLERKLVGVPTMQLRLAEPPKIGEPLDAIGFGRCATSQGIKRNLRNGGPIRATTGETIEIVASVCPGDSGGPLIARGSNQVVGVVSLSAMDGDEHTKAPSVMARIDAFRQVFSHARMIADGTPQNELPPLSCSAF